MKQPLVDGVNAFSIVWVARQLSPKCHTNSAEDVVKSVHYFDVLWVCIIAHPSGNIWDYIKCGVKLEAIIAQTFTCF